MRPSPAPQGGRLGVSLDPLATGVYLAAPAALILVGGEGALFPSLFFDGDCFWERLASCLLALCRS